MSKKEYSAQQALMGDTRGMRELPDTLRRGARMSPTQLRWCLFIATVLVLGLIVLIIVSQQQATAILKANEKK